EPSNLYVAKFIGEANIFETKVLKASESHLEVKIEDQHFQFANKKGFKTNDIVYVSVRPEDIRVWDQREIDQPTELLPGIVEQVIYKGSTVDLMVRLSSNKIIAASEFFDEDDEKLEYEIGEKVWIEWTPGWEVILAHD